MRSRRRTLALAGGGLAVLAGCSSGPFSRDGVTDIVLFNGTDDGVRVTVVADSDSDDRPPYLSDTVALPPDGRKEYDDPIPNGVSVVVRVSVEGGPANSREWPGEGADAKQFYVEILAETVEFTVGER